MCGRSYHHRNSRTVSAVQMRHSNRTTHAVAVWTPLTCVVILLLVTAHFGVEFDKIGPHETLVFKVKLTREGALSEIKALRQLSADFLCSVLLSLACLLRLPDSTDTSPLRCEGSNPTQLGPSSAWSVCRWSGRHGSDARAYRRSSQERFEGPATPSAGGQEGTVKRERVPARPCDVECRRFNEWTHRGSASVFPRSTIADHRFILCTCRPQSQLSNFKCPESSVN
jgi:hypothetical protein